MPINTTDKGTSALPIQKQTKVDLTLDLIALPVGSKYATISQGETYIAKSGKSKGQALKRKYGKIGLPTVSKLTEDGDKDAVATHGKLGLDLKHKVVEMVQKLDRDNRIICTGVTHAVDAAGLARMAIGFKQTTAQRLLSSLLAHGVPMKEAKAIAGKYE